MPHYSRRQWSRADLEALQGLSKQLRMYCAKIRAALAPIREAVSTRRPLPICTLPAIISGSSKPRCRFLMATPVQPMLLMPVS